VQEVRAQVHTCYLSIMLLAGPAVCLLPYRCHLFASVAHRSHLPLHCRWGPCLLLASPFATRSWTAEQRLKHRAACKAKGKLSLGQKLEIIALHQSRDPAQRKTQVLFGPPCILDPLFSLALPAAPSADLP